MFNIKPKVMELKLPIEAQRMVEEMTKLNATEVCNYDTYSLLEMGKTDVYHRMNVIREDMTQQKLQEEAEATKQADMNPVHRALYKTIQKPIGDFFNTFKKEEPEEVPFVRHTQGSIWGD
jgi:hypothetical protein